MAICPTCMATFEDGTSTCVNDGSALVPEEAYAHVDKDLGPGDVVGEYRIEGTLGEGGFGTVYRALHPVIGKHAAVKVLSRAFSANPQMVSRFIAEARAVNQIRHRNIIDIFAFGQLPDGRQYYVMELLDGLPFDRYLARHERLTLKQALPILRGIARALDAAHAKGIVHRDLKPENVFLVFDEDGGVSSKLLDFGLVKLLPGASGGSADGEHKTKTGTPMGTPYYMSPEQCRGLDVERGTDVYAFGALVFEVLTGRVPFQGRSPMDILLKHMTQEPPHASELCEAVPPALDAPLTRMLAKDPGDRPSTVSAGLDELVAALPETPGEDTQLPPPSFAPLDAPPPFHGAATLPTSEVEARVPVASPARLTPREVLSSPDAADVSPHGRTMIASGSDVPAPRPSRTRAAVLVAAGALVAGAAAIVLLGTRGPHRERAAERAAAASSSTTSSASPASASGSAGPSAGSSGAVVAASAAASAAASGARGAPDSRGASGASGTSGTSGADAGTSGVDAGEAPRKNGKGPGGRPNRPIPSDLENFDSPGH